MIVRRITALAAAGAVVVAAAVASLAAGRMGRVYDLMTQAAPQKVADSRPKTDIDPASTLKSPAIRASSAPAPSAPAVVPLTDFYSILGPEREASPLAPRTPTCPGNREALGISRVVEIDTAGGPGFGFEQFKAHDFLEAGEVVLTFDDGPWPGNTPAVLAALAAQCVKATFFPIGKHATWHPEILKQVAAHGHTVGSHTWSHADLSKKSMADAQDEIERGISAVAISAGRPLAPFFRFPALRHTPELTAYLGQRNIGIFSTDLDSFDFKVRKPDQVVLSVMTKLKRRGKGIILMHDFQKSTAAGLPELLVQLKVNGYKVVQLKAKNTVATLAEYDAAITKAQAGQTVDVRPTETIVRTISGDAN
jgi:peptidoglycan/xylan/chitin deacetylase (PgdA/CDA1 family)